jgi:mono/diheme cytochrome c family protein
MPFQPCFRPFIGRSDSYRPFAATLAAFLLVALVYTLPASRLQAQAQDPESQSLAEATRNHFGQHCFDCHGNGSEEGGFNFEKLTSGEYGKRSHSKWEAVWKNVRAQTMPPSEAEHPSNEQRLAWIRWIQTDVFRLDPNQIDPGHAVLRRLNRVEYRDTIKQLTDVDYNVDEEFPADDTGYGFDTVGESLTLSPVLLEKYLAAASEIVTKCIPVEGPSSPERVLWRDHWKSDSLEGAESKSLGFNERGSFHLKQEIRTPNRYRMKVEWALENGWAHTAQEGMIRLSVIDEQSQPKQIAEQRVAYDEGKPGVITAEIDLPKGDAHFALEFQPTNADATAVNNPKEQYPYRFVVRRSVLVGPLNDGSLEYPETFRRIFSNGPPPADPDARREHIRTLLRSFAGRAFRRPIDEPTLDRLCNFALEAANEPGNRFEHGVGIAIQLILASPRFIFRTEQTAAPESDQDVGNGLAVPLDDYSIATRLSYLLWGSPPDDELLQIASTGKLREQLDQQFERMIAQEWRLRTGVANFVGQWLQTRDVAETQADITRILGVKSYEEAEKTFDWQIKEAMRDETYRLVQHLITANRPAEELLNAKYSFLNERLAKFYGIEGVHGNEVRKVDLPATSHRRGIMTHGSLLLVTSNPTRTSPVKRGQFVLENLLGSPAPPAPPNVPALEQSKSGDLKKASLREILEFHRRDAACAACHQRMDPLGLAMEHYNALGQYRETERIVSFENKQRQVDQQAINASGKLMSGESFDGAEELAELLAANRKEDYYRCITEKLMTFALGRGITYRDATTIDNIIEKVKNDGGKMKTLYKAIITSIPFTHCRTREAANALASQHQ